MDSAPPVPRRQRRGLQRRIVVAVVATTSALFGIVLVFAQPVSGATPHRAAVVVEVNGVIHTAKITFTSDSISGLDALRDAGFAPSVRVFGGNGGAVCALDVGGTTIGCPADSSCLTCSAESDYWAYWRALAGDSKYTYSIAGGGYTQVRDGGVEAWNWSTGAAPSPFVSFHDVWGSDPTTTRPPATHAPTTHAPPSTPVVLDPLAALHPTTTVPAPTRPGVSAPTVAPTTTVAGHAGSTTVPVTTGVRAAEPGKKSHRLATAPVVAKGHGGSSWGLVGFALILALLLAAILFARRRRAQTFRA